MQLNVIPAQYTNRSNYSEKKPFQWTLTPIPTPPPSRTPGLRTPQRSQLIWNQQIMPGRCLILVRDESGMYSLPIARLISCLSNQDAPAVRLGGPSLQDSRGGTLFACNR